MEAASRVLPSITAPRTFRPRNHSADNSPKCAASWSLAASTSTESAGTAPSMARSEEHTSELQSRPHLVCRLLLEKKNNPRASATVATHTSRRRTRHQTRVGAFKAPARYG